MDYARFTRTKEWADRIGGWDLRQYILNNIAVPDVVVLSALLWPDLIERAGAVFVEFLFDEESYGQWLAREDRDARSVEKAINHLHLWDIFDPKSDQEYAALADLAVIIARMWQIRGGSAFPDRDFVVTVSGEPEEYGPTITLYSG